MNLYRSLLKDDTCIEIQDLHLYIFLVYWKEVICLGLTLLDTLKKSFTKQCIREIIYSGFDLTRNHDIRIYKHVGYLHSHANVMLSKFKLKPEKNQQK